MLPHDNMPLDNTPRQTTRRATVSHRWTSRAAAVMTAAALTLAACGSDDDGGATADSAADATTVAETSSTTTSVAVAGGATSADTTTAVPTTDAPATTPAPVESTTTAPPETTTTTTEPPAAGDCIVGTWSLRSQEFLDEIVASLPADLTGGQIVEWDYLSGEYLITFGADGSTRGQRIAWMHRIATPEGALVTTIDSDDPGTYSVDGDQISVSDDGSEATVRLQIEVGGQLQDLPIGGTQTVGTDAIAGTGTYTCDGDVLEVTLLDFPDAPPGGFSAVFDRQS